MDNEKRTLMAFVLIAAFLYVWFEYFVPKPQPPKPGEVAKPMVAEKSSEGEPRPAEAEPLREKDDAKTKKKTEKAKPAIEEVRMPFETDVAKGVWTNRGGTLDKLILTQFQRNQGEPENVVVIPFKPGAERVYLWNFEVDGERASDEETVYQIVDRGENRMVFQKDFFGKIRVQKEFRWERDSYEIEHELRVLNITGRSIEFGSELTMSSAKGSGKSGGLFSGPVTTPLGAVAYINESSVRLTPGDILDDERFPDGPIEWAALDSHYFLVAAIPIEGLWRGVSASAETETQGDDEGARNVTLEMKYAPKTLASGAQSIWKLGLFGGPKDISILHNARDSLDRVIDLGDWLGPIARAILRLLRFLHGILGNYGLAIIALTVMVRLLMFPLAQMQAKSMRKMQEHKPQMDALKEKYKDNKEAYSRELMTYMKTHKINPMGGCLLLLPQMPIFFALYRVLYNSIELRHSPFVFWLVDLSAKDPYFVMPILLGIAMFFQTRLTPSPGADPMQQNMMKMMPVMFTVFMLFLPAGLNLYILISTLWGIGQQLWVQRDMKVSH